MNKHNKTEDKQVVARVGGGGVKQVRDIKRYKPPVTT